MLRSCKNQRLRFQAAAPVEITLLDAQKPLTSATVRKWFAMLSAMFEWAIGEQLLDKNPVANLKPPKDNGGKRDPLSLDDIPSVLSSSVIAGNDRPLGGAARRRSGYR
jgi:site-specific recombinase XerD